MCYPSIRWAPSNGSSSALNTRFRMRNRPHRKSSSRFVLSSEQRGLRLTELGLQIQATPGFGLCNTRLATKLCSIVGLMASIAKGDVETFNWACLNYRAPGGLYKYAT